MKTSKDWYHIFERDDFSFPSFLQKELPDEYENKGRSWGEFLVDIGDDAADALYARWLVERNES